MTKKPSIEGAMYRLSLAVKDGHQKVYVTKGQFYRDISALIEHVQSCDTAAATEPNHRQILNEHAALEYIDRCNSLSGLGSRCVLDKTYSHTRHRDYYTSWEYE